MHKRVLRLAVGLGSSAALSACAGFWPDDNYIHAYESDVPPPYSEPARPRFEFEGDRADPTGPAFREPTPAQRQERITAERLADAQRNYGGRYDSSDRRVVERSPSRRTEGRGEARRDGGIETLPAETVQGEAYELPQEPAYSPTPVAGAVSTIPPMPEARPGECFALVRRPEQYRTVTRRIVKRPAYERLEVVPARYVRDTETVTVQEPYEVLEVVPATFKTVTERVMVREPSVRIVTTEPVYETVQERIMVQPPRSVWKPGRGPIERLDHATGEIMCLVEEPAVYKTVTRRVLKEPARTREVQVPAQYRTITRRVIDRPAQVRRVRVPAQTEQVTVERLSEPAAVRRVTVPAEYETVQVRELAAPAQLEWRSILCQTNMTRENIRAVQRALAEHGYDPGPIDGVIGRKTMEAVNAYQRANNLPVDRYLNMDTIRHLGVRLR